jgi:hypothetical protein
MFLKLQAASCNAVFERRFRGLEVCPYAAVTLHCLGARAIVHIDDLSHAPRKLIMRHGATRDTFCILEEPQHLIGFSIARHLRDTARRERRLCIPGSKPCVPAHCTGRRIGLRRRFHYSQCQRATRTPFHRVSSHYDAPIPDFSSSDIWCRVKFNDSKNRKCALGESAGAYTSSTNSEKQVSAWLAKHPGWFRVRKQTPLDPRGLRPQG